MDQISCLKVGSSSDNTFVSGAGGQRVESLVGQIAHSVPTARHHRDIFLKRAVLPWRKDAEMGPAKSLHASANYSEYNKTFDWFDLKVGCTV